MREGAIPESTLPPRTLSWLLGLALSLLATGLFFYRAVFSDEIFIWRDIQQTYYPLRQYWAERISHGEFPLWYPYDALGQPFVGMVISGAFHPSNLLYLLLPAGLALKVNTLLCFPMALFGAYLLGRQWKLERGPAGLVSTLFALNGYMVGITNNLLYLMAASTVPWTLWACSRLFADPSWRRASVAALCLALILLTGDSQCFLVACALVPVVGLATRLSGGGRGWFGWGVGTLAWAVALGAVQILPALDVLKQAALPQRNVDLAQTWSVHPLQLLDLAFGPVFSGNKATGVSVWIQQRLLDVGQTTPWVESLHVGLPALALGLAALVLCRRSSVAWVVCTTLVALLALAMGKHVGLYRLVFDLFPPWRAFRYPEKLMPFVLLGIALGAGAALHLTQTRARSRFTLAKVMLGCCGLALAVFVLENSLADSHPWLLPPFGRRIPKAIADGILDLVLRASLATAVLSAMLATVFRFLARPELRSVAVILAYFGYLLSEVENQYDLTVPDTLREPSEFARAILARGGSGHLGGPRLYSSVDGYALRGTDGWSLVDSYTRAAANGLTPVIGALWGIEGSNQGLPAASRFLSELEGNKLVFISKFAGLFGTRFFTVGYDWYRSIHGREDRILAENPAQEVLLLDNPEARPRAFLAEERCVASPSEVVRALLAPGFEPSREAVVVCEGAPTAPEPRAPAEGTARVVSYRPERVEVEVEAASPSLLVLNDAYYGGWQADVDGQETSILRTNQAVRGVRVAAGTHRVVFRYTAPLFWLGLGVTLVAILLAVAAIRHHQPP